MKYQSSNKITSLQPMLHNNSNLRHLLTIKTKTKVWWTMKSKKISLIFRKTVKHASITLLKIKKGKSQLVLRTVLHWWFRHLMQYMQAMLNKFPSLSLHSLISKRHKNLIRKWKILNYFHKESSNHRLKKRSFNNRWWRLLIEDQSLTQIIYGMISNQ